MYKDTMMIEIMGQNMTNKVTVKKTKGWLI